MIDLIVLLTVNFPFFDSVSSFFWGKFSHGVLIILIDFVYFKGCYDAL
jgi:hypothetical protein